MSGFFDELDRELRRATVRRAAAHRAARRTVLGHAPRSTVAATALLVLVGVVALALTFAGRSAPDGVPADAARLASPRDEWNGLSQAPGADGLLLGERPAQPALLDLLGVLRRPQVATDRNADAVLMASASLWLPPRLGAKPQPAERPRMLLPSVRRAAAGDWGGVWLVPFAPPSARVGRQDLGSADRLAVFLRLVPGPQGRRRATGVAPATAISTGIAPAAAELAREGFVASVTAGRQTVAAAIVPDGVATVELVQPPARGASGPPTTRDVAVHGNVAVLVQTIEGIARPPRQSAWYAADGRLIERFSSR